MPEVPHQLTPDHITAINAAIQAVPRDEAPSGILYHPLFHTLDGDRFISGAPVEAGLQDFRQIVWELIRSAHQADPVADLDTIDAAVTAVVHDRVVPVALLDCRFEALTAQAMKRFVATVAAGGDLDLTDPAGLLETRRVSLCRPLIESVADGAQVSFSFDAGWQAANTGDLPVEISFDPGDGQGPRSVAPGGQIEARYDSTGDKTLTATLKFADGHEAVTTTSLRVRALNLPWPTWREVVEFTYDGVLSKGVVAAYHVDNRKEIKRPLFFWTGFDTGSTSGDSLVGHWSATADDYLADDEVRKLLEECRRSGWDVVIVTFLDTKRPIQHNATIARKAIELVNRKADKDRLPGAVLTGSMGGLVARYALLAKPPADPSLNIAKAIFFDSPFKGAVIPMSVQYALDFFAGVSNEAYRRRELYLNSPSAKQMLVQVYDPWWTQQDHPQPDATFKALDAEFTAMGHWPKDIQCYAATSGSGKQLAQLDNKGNRLKPEDLMLYAHRWDGPIWKANAWLHAAPSAVQRRQHRFKSTAVGHPPGRHWDAWVGITPPWDSCPGGYYDSVEQFGRGYAWSKLEVYASNSCFIPTLSALNIDPSNDPYAAPPAAPAPFVSAYRPDDNTKHCKLTVGVTLWIKAVLEMSSD